MKGVRNVQQFARSELLELKWNERAKNVEITPKQESRIKSREVSGSNWYSIHDQLSEIESTTRDFPDLQIE